MAATHNLTIEQGATFSRTFTWKDSAGALINLTGYSARMKVRDLSGNELLSLVSPTNIVLGGAAGTIAITISAAATAALQAVFARYDLELESGGGVVTRLLKGAVLIETEQTR